MATEEQNNPTVIELPEAIENGLYSNFAIITPSETEFVLDFANTLPRPGEQSLKVQSRIIMTPQNLKRHVRLLMQHIQEYERHVGTIHLPEDAQAPQGNNTPQA